MVHQQQLLEWQREQRELDRKWHKEAMRVNIRLVLISAVIGFVSALATVALVYLLLAN